MSDDLVKSLEWSCRDPVTHESIDDGDYSNATVSEVKQAIAEIARLRSALAAARREGMEEVERHFRIAAAGTPLGYEDHQRGASVYNWLMYCATTIAAIRAAAKEDRQP